MTRYCVIGNSHLACLKQGWDVHRSRYADDARFRQALVQQAKMLLVGEAVGHIMEEGRHYSLAV